MSTKKIEIEIPDGKKAEWVNGVLTLVDEVKNDNRPVTERIKTFEDAYNELGSEHPYCQSYDNAHEWLEDDEVDVIAYLKLRSIVAALKEGWEPQFTEDEYRYYPWFRLLTEDELNDNDEDEKQKRAVIELSARVVGRAGINAYAYGGLACAVTGYASSLSVTYSGSRLSFKS